MNHTTAPAPVDHLFNAQHICLHVIKTHAAGNPNRDDQGRPKEIMVGGTSRQAYSSQCLKFALREGPLFAALRAAMARDFGGVDMVRTTLVGEEIVAAMIANGTSEEIAYAGANAVMATMSRKAAEKAAESDEDPVEDAEKKKAPVKKASSKPKKNEAIPLKVDSGQLIAVSRMEINEIARYLASVDHTAKDWAAKALKDSKLMRDRGARFGHGDLAFEISLFGRFVTSDLFSNIRSAVQTAYSFTVHEAAITSDMFVGNDDVRRQRGLSGSGHMNERLMGSGTYYQFSSINVGVLMENLRQSHVALTESELREVAFRIIRTYIYAFAMENPIACQTSMASAPDPDFIAIEVGDMQPLSAASAYERAIVGTEGYREEAANRFKTWLDRRHRLMEAETIGQILTWGLYDHESLKLKALCEAGAKCAVPVAASLDWEPSLRALNAAAIR